MEPLFAWFNQLNSFSQFQPASHMPSPAVPVSGQHWSGSQGSTPFAPAQQAADPSSISAVNVPVSSIPLPSRE